MESKNSHRFKRLCDKLGYHIVPLTSKINGMYDRRHDVMRVEKYGDFIMVIPRRMYGFPIAAYRDMLGGRHPDFFTCEKTLLLKRYGK